MGNFAGNISPEQRAQLIQWLAEHTYEEVVELVAQDAPHGFGIKVGKSTIARFYKANYEEIYRAHRARIQDKMFQTVQYPDGPDYRYVLRDSYSQLLLERLWELLSRPVDSADELKKLVVIAEKLKSIDRDKDVMEEVLNEKAGADLSRLFSALKPKKTSA